VAVLAEGTAPREAIPGRDLDGPPGLSWRSDDGVNVVFSPGSRWRPDPTAPDARLWLDAGACAVAIEASASRPFAVHGPDTVVQAQGTAFRVTVADGRTSVAVDHGAVRVRRGDQERMVHPGEFDRGIDDGALTLGERLRQEDPLPDGEPPVLALGVQDPDLAALLADRFAIPLVLPVDPDWGEEHLRDPLHPLTRSVAAARNRPTVVIIERVFRAARDGDGGDLPDGSVLRDGQGMAIHPDPQATGQVLISPLVGDAVVRAQGAAVGEALRRQFVDRGVAPRAVLWRTHQSLALAAGAAPALRDPRVVAAIAASGEPADRWFARQQARVDRLALAAATAAAGLDPTVPWIELGGGWQSDQGRYGWWRSDVPDAELRAVTGAWAAPVLWEPPWPGADGNGIPTDPLTRILAVAAGNHRLGVRGLIPLAAAWPAERIPGWGRTLGMLGARSFIVEDAALADLSPGSPVGRALPPALHRLLTLARLRQEIRARIPDPAAMPLVAGPEPHPYRADSPVLPSWRLPVPGDPLAVVLARRRGDGSHLILGWAADGRTRAVRVTLPGRGELAVLCSALGRWSRIE
jgi:hypothetical protein